jgi:predicted NUDIX family NTP pyrophosphohydrolase
VPVHSAGFLLFRRRDALEVLLVHPGGPFWAGKDAGAWSVPKGEYDPQTEDAYEAARREFAEEIGREPPEGDPIDLGEITQRGGKVVRAWAVEGDLDAAAIRSNTFRIEWPPRSGRIAEFPEVDRAGWFDPAAASAKLLEAQRPLLVRLVEAAGG